MTMWMNGIFASFYNMKLFTSSLLYICLSITFETGQWHFYIFFVSKCDFMYIYDDKLVVIVYLKHMCVKDWESFEVGTVNFWGGYLYANGNRKPAPINQTWRKRINTHNIAVEIESKAYCETEFLRTKGCSMLVYDFISYNKTSYILRGLWYSYLHCSNAFSCAFACIVFAHSCSFLLLVQHFFIRFCSKQNLKLSAM